MTNIMLFKKMHPDLPIFEIPLINKTIIYSPGSFFVLKHNENVNIAELLSSENNTTLYSFQKQLDHLILSAQGTVNEWHQKKNGKFNPECLTIYISNDCKLSCSYCYSRINKVQGKNNIVDIESVLIAAEFVANNCKKENKPFILILHGGGEPTFHWQLFMNILNKIKKLTSEKDIVLFSYVATNGIMEESKVKWLARKINLIGLSCDGPPKYNNLQRGKLLNERIEKTIKIIVNEGGDFKIRATITKNTIDKQQEIVEYFINKLNSKKIFFEPEYQNSDNSFTEKDANIFVNHFLLAEKYANMHGAELYYAGVRIDEIHDSYCDIFRNTLRLNPEGTIINCFCDTDYRRFPIGNIDKVSKLVILDKITALRKKENKTKAECLECINLYHCSKGCPDYCNFDENSQLSSFRCRVNVMLAIEYIKRKAFGQLITNEL